MTRPLSRAEEARERLRLAGRDLRVAELALADVSPLIGEALYHAQQAAEKALKGLLVWHEAKYPLTHDIRRAGPLCTDRSHR
jgi:HEPN domain-containing protein